MSNLNELDLYYLGYMENPTRLNILQNNIVMLKGIGSNGICSTVKVLSNVKINDNFIEILFHVVGNDHMQNDIVIGREILKPGLEIVISSIKFTISRAKIINLCTVLSQPILIPNYTKKIK